MKNLLLLTACLLCTIACKEAQTDAPKEKKTQAPAQAAPAAAATQPDSVGNYAPELLATMKKTCADNAMKRSKMDPDQVERLCDCVVSEMTRRSPNKDDLAKLMADDKLKMEIALKCADV